jgi:hypothetical protein
METRLARIGAYSYLGLAVVCSTTATATPSAYDSKNDVTWRGIYRTGPEVFLSVPYGQDTGGDNRFKPPQAYVPDRGSTIQAVADGVACPQDVDVMRKMSEDCLSLNLARPSKTTSKDRLPVLVFIYGGGLWSGSAGDDGGRHLQQAKPSYIQVKFVVNKGAIVTLYNLHRITEKASVFMLQNVGNASLKV